MNPFEFIISINETKKDIMVDDVSEKGFNQSLCFMVNYLYDLNDVEKNHEKYVVDKKINTSKKLLKEFQKS